MKSKVVKSSLSELQRFESRLRQKNCHPFIVRTMSKSKFPFFCYELNQYVSRSHNCKRYLTWLWLLWVAK